MKKFLAVLILVCASYISKAQDEESSEDVQKGFKKENLFVGGDITLGFSNLYTALGASRISATA